MWQNCHFLCRQKSRQKIIFFWIILTHESSFLWLIWHFKYHWNFWRLFSTFLVWCGVFMAFQKCRFWTFCTEYFRNIYANTGIKIFNNTGSKNKEKMIFRTNNEISVFFSKIFDFFHFEFLRKNGFWSIFLLISSIFQKKIRSSYLHKK